MTGNPYSPRPTAISHASPLRRAAMDAPSTSPIPTARLPYMGTSRSSATTSKIRTRGALPYPAKQHQSLSPADRFPLKQGEQFAWSGNTGSSAGPHLHFEIRDSRTQRTLNTISSGVIRTRDDIPPRLVKLYYVEVDSVRGVPVHARPRPVELVEKRPDAMRSNRKEHSPSAAEVTSSWRRPTAKTTYPTHSDSGAYANLQTKIRSSSFVSTASPSTRPATATPSPTTPCRSPRATK